MQMAIWSIGILALTATLAAGVLWAWASTYKPHLLLGTLGGPSPEAIREFNRQGALNRWAAVLAVISALLQFFALFVSF
jgi:hypothetical protein